MAADPRFGYGGPHHRDSPTRRDTGRSRRPCYSAPPAGGRGVRTPGARGRGFLAQAGGWCSTALAPALPSPPARPHPHLLGRRRAHPQRNRSTASAPPTVRLPPAQGCRSALPNRRAPASGWWTSTRRGAAARSDATRSDATRSDATSIAIRATGPHTASRLPRWLSAPPACTLPTAPRRATGPRPRGDGQALAELRGPAAGGRDAGGSSRLPPTSGREPRPVVRAE
ncbi:hypothetical protein STTU_2870 [Streptomyces sp. Tu6071]|nr:hypothetical protein STTU_2870 [Streptomyces sp. Tu6071]